MVTGALYLGDNALNHSGYYTHTYFDKDKKLRILPEGVFRKVNADYIRMII
jgi:hypothetical protein